MDNVIKKITVRNVHIQETPYDIALPMPVEIPADLYEKAFDLGNNTMMDIVILLAFGGQLAKKEEEDHGNILK